MGWDRKKRGAAGGYFYASVRTPAGVRKVYLGRGAAAGEVADAIAAKRRARDAARAERAALAGPDRLAGRLVVWAGAMAAAWLVATGHRCHRGCWRRKAVTDPTAPAGPKTPRESKHMTPAFVLFLVKSLADRAARGEADAADKLMALLERFPEHRAAVRALDGVTEKAEAAWVRAAGHGNPVREAAARDDLARTKADLAGPDPGALERLLAGAVAVAHLAHAVAAEAAAAKVADPAAAAARDRRWSDAQARLFAAARAYKLVAGKKAAGASTPPGIKLFEPDAAEAG